jgi:hypothetical protein
VITHLRNFFVFFFFLSLPSSLLVTVVLPTIALKIKAAGWYPVSGIGEFLESVVGARYHIVGGGL